MNRNELIDAVAKDSEESKATVNRVLDTLLHVVQKTVARGEEVKLSGFGKFQRALVGARKGRNLATGEQVTIPERFSARFRVGAEFKARVRG